VCHLAAVSKLLVCAGNGGNKVLKLYISADCWCYWACCSVYFSW